MIRNRREFLWFASRNRKLLLGLAVVLAFLAVAVVGPLLTDHGPNEYVAAAVTIYLDLLNLFMAFLRILGRRD